MSAEKLPFVIPAVCTIGPRVDDHESLLKYAKLISPHDKLSNHIKELVQRIIQGEIRVLASSSMTMEKVFRGTKVFEKVQLELNQFGLLIYNAMVDVAEAKIKGEVGSKSREGQTLQNAAKIDAETKEGIRVRRTEVKAEASYELAKKTN